MFETLKQIEPILRQAQQTYGTPNQMMVAIEELCELTAVMLKPISADDTYDALKETYAEFKLRSYLDEVADVYIVLQHVCMILQIDNFDLLNIKRQTICKSYQHVFVDLATVLTKYPRYSNDADALAEIRRKAEPMINKCYLYLNTLRVFYGINRPDLIQRVLVKAARVERWLASTKDFSESLVDREV